MPLHIKLIGLVFSSDSFCCTRIYMPVTYLHITVFMLFSYILCIFEAFLFIICYKLSTKIYILLFVFFQVREHFHSVNSGYTDEVGYDFLELNLNRRQELILGID